jgi:hypothetical protein
MIKSILVRKIILVLAVLIVAATAVYAFINKPQTDKTVDNENKTPSGTQSESSIPLPVTKATVEEAINKYPTTQLLKPEYGGKVFCSYYHYGFDEEKEKNMVYAYTWVYCEEYYKEGGNLKMGSGVSMPVKFALELQNGTLGVQGHEVPEDGEGYGASIRKMFKAEYATEAINGYDVSKFKITPKMQAEKTL